MFIYESENYSIHHYFDTEYPDQQCMPINQHTYLAEERYAYTLSGNPFQLKNKIAQIA